MCKSVLLSAVMAMAVASSAIATYAPPPVYGPYGGSGPQYTVIPTGDPRGTTFDEAVKACSALGLTLVGDDNVVRNLCAFQLRTTCWVNREPVFASNGERLCAIMTQTGDVPFQGCGQQVGYVCAKDGKRVNGHLPDTTGTYLIYTEAGSVKTYDQAVAECSKVGVLVTNEAVVRHYCSLDQRTTCWVGGLPVQTQSNGERLCAMLSQEGDKYYQLCDQKLGFVCDTSAGPFRRPPPSRRMLLEEAKA